MDIENEMPEEAVEVDTVTRFKRCLKSTQIDTVQMIMGQTQANGTGLIRHG